MITAAEIAGQIDTMDNRMPANSTTVVACTWKYRLSEEKIARPKTCNSMIGTDVFKLSGALA